MAPRVGGAWDKDAHTLSQGLVSSSHLSLSFQQSLRSRRPPGWNRYRNWLCFLSLSIPSAEHFAHELSVPPRHFWAHPPVPGVQPFSGPSPRNFHTKKELTPTRLFPCCHGARKWSLFTMDFGLHRMRTTPSSCLALLRGKGGICRK